jgi:hypothetical protein
MDAKREESAVTRGSLAPSHAPLRGEPLLWCHTDVCTSTHQTPHLDMPATAWHNDNKPWSAKDPTGIAFRSLIDFAMKLK